MIRTPPPLLGVRGDRSARRIKQKTESEISDRCGVCFVLGCCCCCCWCTKVRCSADHEKKSSREQDSPLHSQLPQLPPCLLIPHPPLLPATRLLSPLLPPLPLPRRLVLRLSPSFLCLALLCARFLCPFVSPSSRRFFLCAAPIISRSSHVRSCIRRFLTSNALLLRLKFELLQKTIRAHPNDATGNTAKAAADADEAAADLPRVDCDRLASDARREGSCVCESWRRVGAESSAEWMRS